MSSVTLPRPAGDGALVPPAARVLAEAAAAAVAAQDLNTACTAGTTLLSMTAGRSASRARSGPGGRLRALGGTGGATVQAGQVPAR